MLLVGLPNESIQICLLVRTVGCLINRAGFERITPFDMLESAVAGLVVLRVLRYVTISEVLDVGRFVV